MRIPLADLKVPGTPTAILVDRLGRVLRIMPGKLDEPRQEALISALEALPVQ